MTSVSPAAPPPASAERPLAVTFTGDALAIANVELRKLVRDPTELFSRAVQPILWLLIFGEVFTRVRAIPTGSMTYLEFMSPGVLAQSVLFSAIFYGIAVIWERDLGIVQKLLASPAPRAALVVGKAIAAGLRGLTQAVIVIVLALLLGVRVSVAPLHLAGVCAAIMLGSGLFATFSLVVACIVKTRERFMGIGQLLTMPLFFASNAIYPIAMMPEWLRGVARGNPLTYLVDALRAMMIEGAAPSSTGVGLDFAVLAAVFLLLVAVAARLYAGLGR